MRDETPDQLGPGLVVDVEDVTNVFHERGWTDGLPVVAPTEERVRAMLAAGPREFDDVLGVLEARGIELTAGKAAVNAVMAGCLPSYFPVLLAMLDAVLDEGLNIHALASSTGGPAPLVVVSGPLAGAIGMNAKGNVFGPGNRANATLGRALRLILVNVFGAVPGLLDGASLGHPGKYTYCIAEDDPPAPWPTLREELGFGRDETVVVTLGGEGPRQVSNSLNPDPEAILRTIAEAIACPANYTVGHDAEVGAECVVVLGPEHADSLREGGWSKVRIREFLHEHTFVTRARMREAGRLVDDGRPGDHLLPTLAGPDAVVLVTAGGYGGRWSSFIPGWATVATTRHSVRPVTAPKEHP